MLGVVCATRNPLLFPLISAPFVKVSFGWFLMQRQGTGRSISAPIDFDVTDMSIHETHHVRCVIKQSVLS